MKTYNNIHQIIILDQGSIHNVSKENNNISTYFDDHNYFLWDSNSLRKLMVDEGDLDVLEAFDKLKPYSFKADLGKYYVVYKFGGWYSDINNIFQSFPPDVKHHDLAIAADRQHLTYNTWAVQATCFYAEKGHYVLKQAIEDVIENCKNNFYGKHALCPTGPTLFGSAVAKFNLPENSNYLIGKFYDDDEGLFVIFNGQKFLQYKPMGLGPGDIGVSGANHYPSMWERREVYE
jgi:mannosyltransferase OCH1-like enzyme